MAKKKDFRNLPIPLKYNEHDILIWDIELLTRIADDLNESLGLDPPIQIPATNLITNPSMEYLKKSIIEGIQLTNI